MPDVVRFALSTERDLYEADPYEMTNLATDPGSAALLAEMQTRLAAITP